MWVALLQKVVREEGTDKGMKSRGRHEGRRELKGKRVESSEYREQLEARQNCTCIWEEGGWSGGGREGGYGGPGGGALQGGRQKQCEFLRS